jgi:hypothetical protein
MAKMSHGMAPTASRIIENISVETVGTEESVVSDSKVKLVVKSDRRCKAKRRDWEYKY